MLALSRLAGCEPQLAESRRRACTSARACRQHPCASTDIWLPPPPTQDPTLALEWRCTRLLLAGRLSTPELLAGVLPLPRYMVDERLSGAQALDAFLCARPHLFEAAEGGLWGAAPGQRHAGPAGCRVHTCSCQP